MTPLRTLLVACCVWLTAFAAPADDGDWRTTRLVVATATGRQVPYRVELAISDAERQQGLMGRRSLAATAGMLFDFGATQPIAMWMRNTHVALDMLFADETGRIVDLIAHTTPLSETLLRPRVPARYVLEVAAGQAAAHGIAIGDRLEFRISP